jgi:hypothetical protein
MKKQITFILLTVLASSCLAEEGKNIERKKREKTLIKFKYYNYGYSIFRVIFIEIQWKLLNVIMGKVIIPLSPIPHCTTPHCIKSAP